MTKQVIEQLLQERIKPVIPASFNLDEICFPEQRKFIMDTAPWVTASCSRRAGKSIGCAVDLMLTAASHNKVTCLYITLTRSTAEKLVWKSLLELNDIHKFGAKANLSKLSLTFPNGSIIYCSGCSNKTEVEKFRGGAFKLVYIDEVQSFPHYLEELIDQVLGPALVDHAGSMKFIGTPAPLKRGFFWNTLQSDNYSHHHWTFWDNPHIASKSGTTHQILMDRELKRRGVSITDPSIRREWFGEWIDDNNALVCQYSPVTNDYSTLPAIITDTVIGIDIGFNDADAIAVLGWNKHDKKCYLLEEIVTPKQGITELMRQIEHLYTKHKPLRMVIDEGGLGKKIAEELRKRYALPVQRAEKTRKQEYIALMNDAFRTRSLFAKKESHFAKDSLIVEWDFDKSTPDKLVIKKEPHSDIFDAVLYAYRESIHWLSEPVKPKEDARTNWAKISEAELYAKMELDEAKKEYEDKQADYWNQLDSYDPFLTDQENSVKYYIDKRKGQK
jgi:PBSX family phage terminase large subunit